MLGLDLWTVRDFDSGKRIASVLQCLDRNCRRERSELTYHLLAHAADLIDGLWTPLFEGPLALILASRRL